MDIERDENNYWETATHTKTGILDEMTSRETHVNIRNMAYVLLKAVETQIMATFTHISAAFKDAISSSARAKVSRAAAGCCRPANISYSLKEIKQNSPHRKILREQPCKAKCHCTHTCVCCNCITSHSVYPNESYYQLIITLPTK
jgi:hypothetical protein